MQSVKRIINYTVIFVSILLPSSRLFSQENSPYSRYGIGDLYPTQTIAARGLAGLTAAYSDGRTLNSDNPASYGDMKSYANGGYFTFDVGISIDARTLNSQSPVDRYKSVNFIPSYLMLGFPLSKKHLGMVIGLKPMSRINYSIQSVTRGPDSMQTLYNGSGGVNQAFIGIGKKWGGFSIGINGGYLFGRKEISTNTILINDTIAYHNGTIASSGNYGGLFANAGAQITLKLGEKTDTLSKIKSTYGLILGVAGMLKQNLDFTSSVLNETYYYDANGGTQPYDTVSYKSSPTEKVTLPMMLNVGIMFTNQLSLFNNPIENKWMVGAEYSLGNWGSQYRINNQKDALVNNWLLRAGGAYTPDITSKNFFSHTTYRLGIFTGKDYINADGNGLKTTALTLGLGLKIQPQRFSNQQTIINLAAEIGKRGTNVNNVTENFFKLSAGLSLSDLWFIKRRYD